MTESARYNEVRNPSSPRIGSLCSGYGGLEMGLIAAVGGSVAWHVEYDKHPSAVLEARFPGVPNYGDVTTTDWTQVEPVDWLTAGYPCQPFSHAGKRKGSADERHLWPAVADAIGVLRPGRVLLENVAGHVSLGLDAVLADLAALGYDSRWGVVRAADAGACHGRARVFIIAADASGDPRGQRDGNGQPPADTTGGGRWRPKGQQRGLGSEERFAAAVADADDRGSRARCAGQDRRCEPVIGVGQGQPAANTDRGRFEGSPELNGDTAQAPADWDSRGGHPHGRRDADGDAACLGVADEPVGGSAQGQHVGSVVGAVRGDSSGRATAGIHDMGGAAAVLAWGQYERAIRRWERVIGRPAPRPTEPGRTGERLSPSFVEWMQGLPAGWVTDILPRSPSLKALGNGVVPQQAALAVRTLLGAEAVAA